MERNMESENGFKIEGWGGLTIGGGSANIGGGGTGPYTGDWKWGIGPF